MQNDAGASVVVVAYRPKAGKRDELLQLVRDHVPYLRSVGMATERAAVIAEAADGTIVEVFEWSPGGVEKAHHHPGVGKMWGQFFAVCDAVPLKDLPEAATQFAGFRPLEL
jgi:hypothetical protein